MTDEQYKQLLKKRCNDLLLALLGSELLREVWWVSFNKGFDGQTPADVFEKNPLAVYNYIVAFAMN
jgi:hypothetical protein